MSHFPQHIAIICDGNRRWAKAQGKPAFWGHQKAVNEVFADLIDQAILRGVKYLTFWIFSTENWQRDKQEVEGLMNLFRGFFDQQIDKLNKKKVKFNMIGRLSDFAPDIQERILKGKAKTKDNQTITVTLAMSYGGRDELVRACQKIGQDLLDKKIAVKDIDKKLIAQNLDTHDLPDPDLVIRPGGEQRISGFLMWQSEYSEYYFPDFYFPEFSQEKFDEALAEFASRQRRFGK